jgi:HlyD family secretion protein
MESEQKEKITETEANSSVNQENKDILNAFKSNKRKEKIKKIIKRTFIIAVIVGIYLLLKYGGNKAPVEEAFNYDEHVATMGSIDVSVEGDGVITANSIYSIVPKVTGEILEDYVETDKFVKKGELLYVIDSKDINSSINQANLGVMQSSVSIEQAESNYNMIQDQIDDLKILANAEGYVENLRIEKGSYVSAMSQICNIAEKNAYEVVLKFRTSNSKDIKIGDRVSLFFVDYFTYIDGSVSKVNDSTLLQDTGAQVTEVTIHVNTEGYDIQNARVEGTIFLSNGMQVLSVDQGYVTPLKSTVVIADSTGNVKELLVDNGTYVHKGDLIASLENSNLNNQLNSAKLSVDNAKISKRNAETNLSSTRKQLDNYNITSPITGKIIYKNLKKGDVISSYQQSSSNVMAIVADVSVMKFEMQIDELDITKIDVGQEVTITVEALENKEFKGKVSNINRIGINSAGSTNYIITVEVPGNDEIYSGMSVDANVKVAHKDDVLLVPLTVIRKGDVVYKKSSNPEFKDEDVSVPKGYEKVKVEIGLNNGDFVEITSGLSSGDVVLADKTTASGTFSLENLGKMMREN